MPKKVNIGVKGVRRNGRFKIIILILTIQRKLLINSRCKHIIYSNKNGFVDVPSPPSFLILTLNAKCKTGRIPNDLSVLSKFGLSIATPQMETVDLKYCPNWWNITILPYIELCSRMFS